MVARANQEFLEPEVESCCDEAHKIKRWTLAGKG